MDIAERELWMALSRLLWSFRFSEDPRNPISLDEYEGLSGRTPLPYKVKIECRHENVRDILLEKHEVSNQL